MQICERSPTGTARATDYALDQLKMFPPKSRKGLVVGVQCVSNICQLFKLGITIQPIYGTGDLCLIRISERRRSTDSRKCIPFQ